MTKEEIINKFIERRKDGIPYIFAGYCNSTECNSCYLKHGGEQFCFEIMFEVLLDRIMELEETQKALKYAKLTEERPKGKWLYHRASNGLVVVKCSECKKTYGFLKTNYCPYCGADMGGSE